MKRNTVLIVDDQLINRTILGKILKDSYEVMYACDGKQCMDILTSKKYPIAAVLLDIMMPEMDGYQVLESMAEDEQLVKIPVIVSSQMESKEAEIKALSLGAQDFVTKPYNPEVIKRRLFNIIKLRENAVFINSVERDELTGLYNKPFFIRKVDETIKENPEKKYDLLCIDIEKFKLVNDTFGLDMGDQLLKYAASVIENEAPKDAICSRIGADVFYVLAERRDNYEGEFIPLLEKINEFPIKIRIRIGIGIYQIDDEEMAVIAMCDRAKLATEKIKGKYDKNYSFYDDSIRQELLNERFITDSMQSSLNQGQFKVYYQPKYDIKDETIAGAEALVRWIHPEKGFMSPGEFIPLFEKNGFITKLDKYVWETVCQNIREWIDEGQQIVPVSVNVSRADIYEPGLVEYFQNLVEKYKIPVHYIHLEVTETCYTESPEQIIDVVNSLRDIGFIIEMDDFGSGYSSLNMLAEIPIDVLKLDMRFIKNESTNASGRGILSFIISLAKWLDVPVIAEGVETEEQIFALRMMDCNYVQGYYYAKPMCRDDFDSLLRKTGKSEMIYTKIKHEEATVRDDSKLSDGKRVMIIVDDVDINRAVLSEIFKNDFTIVEAEDGSKAWNYLNDNFEYVDIILLDLLMPVMDGFQLLSKIRNDDRTKFMPVIITSQGDETSEERALEMMADDFISKPYNEGVVKHRVRNVLDHCRMDEIQREKTLIEKIKRANIDIFGNKDKDIVQINMEMEYLRKYFDIVRLVDAENTKVIDCEDACDVRGCFTTWGKIERCSNCVSLRALRNCSRYNKTESIGEESFYVISQYVKVDGKEAVIEMVSKMDK